MSVVEAGAAPYADDALLPGSEAGRRRRAQFALFILRAAVPFFPVAAVLTASDASVATPAVLILATGWFIALRRMFSSAWLSPLALGIPIIAALGALSGLAMMSGFAYWLPGDDVSPLELSLMAAAVYVASAAAESIARRTGLVYPRVLIVGAGNGGVQLAEELYGNPDLPFRCLGLLVEDGEDWTSETVRVLGTTDDVEDLLELWEPDIAVLASGENGKTVSAVLDGEENGIRLLSLPHFYEHVFGRVPIHTLSPTWFMSLVHLRKRPYPRITKRVFDLVVVSVGLVLASPLFLLGAILVRLSGPGPVFYRQWRLGERGRPFQMLKFRTMIDGAEPPDQAIWAVVGDPRVTRVGRIMRRTRLDELPQLWNVLIGEMSIVGPRPERTEFYELLAGEIPYWTRRHLIKPGITGWAQVCRGYTSNVGGAAEKLAYDLYYLKHQSLLLDLAVTAKTTTTLLSGFGAR